MLNAKRNAMNIPLRLSIFITTFDLINLYQIMKTYSTKEAAEIVGIKERAVQYRCKRDNIRKKDNKYLITDEIISLWITKEEEANAILNAKRNANKNIAFSSEEEHQEKLKEAIELITIEAAKKNVTHKIFTEEEYVDLIGTLDRVEHQQEQIQYLRNRIELQDAALTNLIKTIEQRNYIEAKKENRKD